MSADAPRLDTEVLIIGAGMSGVGLAVQLRRKFGVDSFELVEKAADVGGTWLANSYPGCACDVASHFYSYSFALNPDWSRLYSTQPEIQTYFRDVAARFDVLPHIRFHKAVERADWDDATATWLVSGRDLRTGEQWTRRCKILVSAVGALSVPKRCDVPGADAFQGSLFHSAEWDHSFNWKGKDVVVLGNGCSATQFVPVMSRGPDAVRSMTQFSRQAQYLSERRDGNPHYSALFKGVMRYVPLAMRLYRFREYASMEMDFAGFDIDRGRPIRRNLADENEAYVKKMAPRRYWPALIPRTEIGCKRKVHDTDYLDTLNLPHVELVPDDPVLRIEADGVRTRAGRKVAADAIVVATGFATQRMLFPMEIRGRDGTSLNDHWDATTQGVAQAYLGTCVAGFPNFFILMGPNTVTGHLSVIYTVECQMNFALRLLAPILHALPSYRAHTRVPRLWRGAEPASVEVTASAAAADSAWTQRAAKQLVWASGCTNWAVDPTTGLNNMLYPDWQFWFWWRSVFVRPSHFLYRDAAARNELRVALHPLASGAVRVAAVALLAALLRALPSVRRLDAQHVKELAAAAAAWARRLLA